MNEFIRIVNMLPERIKQPIITAVGSKDDFTEIRLRSERPISLIEGNKPRFICAERLSDSDIGALCITLKELIESLQRLSGYSLYARQREINEGYFTMRGGHRVGICSSATDNGVDGFSANAVNIRIARERKGCADELLSQLPNGGKNASLLIFGAVLSGKTTILRDCVRRLSSAPNFQKVALIDERREIAAVWQGAPTLGVGSCTDVLDGYTRPRGAEIAVRALSPDIIACDEIGSEQDTEALLSASFSGVRVFATAHAGSIDELMKKANIRKLIENGVFEHIAQIGKNGEIGKLASVIKAEEI